MDKCWRKKWSKRIKGLILWIGSILGILITCFTIWDRVTKPDLPDLRASFALTGKPSLMIATEPRNSAEFFPLDLVVENKGHLTAHNVRLKLVDSGIYKPRYNSRLLIKTDKTKFSQNSIHVGESTRQMTTIPLGEIHPGESIYVESVLQAELSTNHAPHFLSQGESLDDHNCPPLPLKHHQIKVRLLADDLIERVLPLYITVGLIKQLEQEGNDIFLAEGGKLLKNN
ncbi:MAG: hypothetical protein ACYSWP_05890 [Planctomycetota bacterium]|jgi:hypothetical protein